MNLPWTTTGMPAISVPCGRDFTGLPLGLQLVARRHADEELLCFAGEVGLSGEIRPVNRVDQRIQEAEKLGFSTIFVSKYNKIALKNTGIKIRLVAKIEDVASELFG
jgi:predicted ATP-dependent serine protease